MSVSKDLAHDALPRASTKLSVSSISIDDLHLLEKDLLFHEKVSVCFLLCRENRDISFIQQELNLEFRVHRGRAIGHQRAFDKSIITTWARNDADSKWREHLVEALAIVKCNRVLKKLGFDLQDIQETYHPLIDEFFVHVHPILKILFRMCEKMTSLETRKLIQHMRNRYDNCGDFEVDSEKFMELHLLNWISMRIISIGDEKGIGSYFDEIIAFLKVNEIDEFWEKLKRFTAIASDANLEERSPGRMKKGSPGKERKDLEDFFHMNSGNMGYVLVINQKNFHKESGREIDYCFLNGDLETRYGTDSDVKSIRETFSAFGFNVIVKDDLRSDEIICSIEEFVGKTEEESQSSLVVVILSHGFQGSVYGSNSIPVEVREIKDALCDERLSDKPKILIIQACQSNDDSGKGKLARDGPSRMGNLITAWSTVEGYTSIRHTIEGTWFIQTLCAKLREFHEKEHFYDILTKVHAEVADKEGDSGETMQPKIDSTLKKKLYLYPMNNF
uniref:Uncharacterized protein n=1 Tax=Phlebotomus papatasi TaxID=29031 RepID=A0A1B0D025_PHLPP